MNEKITNRGVERSAGACGCGCGCGGHHHDEGEHSVVERVVSWLSSVPLTIVSGVALVASLVMKYALHCSAMEFAWVAVIVSGIPLAYAALSRLLGERKITSALLRTIALVAGVLTDEVFAAGEVAFIMDLGELLEDYTVARAKRGLNTLVKMAPSNEGISVGDIIEVKRGDHVPVDGVVVSGETTIDQAVMTGESEPVAKVPGDAVYCGTTNMGCDFSLRATAVGEDTSLQRMIQLVREAEKNKAPMQRIVDRWAAWLVPIALAVAVVAGFTIGWTEAVTVLVVFCPCALALATPVAIVAGIGQATKFGVLIKSGEALETMGKVDCITFDKTGTLTIGREVRATAAPMVAELRAMGVESVMLSGDREEIAREVAERVGIEQYHAELMPETKLRAVEELKTAGHRVCHVGDGVNDAPALKTAHVGIAMGAIGTDVAADSADIILMTDDIARIPYIKRLAVAVRRSITVNITLSMVINAVAIVLSLMGWLTPVTGALWHNAGSVLVVMNAALLYDRKI